MSESERKAMGGIRAVSVFPLSSQFRLWGATPFYFVWLKHGSGQIPELVHFLPLRSPPPMSCYILIGLRQFYYICEQLIQNFHKAFQMSNLLLIWGVADMMAPMKN